MILGASVIAVFGCGDAKQGSKDIGSADDRTINAAMEEVDEILASQSQLATGALELQSDYNDRARGLVAEYRRTKDKALLGEIAEAGFPQLVKTDPLTAAPTGLDPQPLSELENPSALGCPSSLDEPIQTILEAVEGKAPDIRIPSQARRTKRAVLSELAESIDDVKCNALAARVRSAAEAG